MLQTLIAFNSIPRRHPLSQTRSITRKELYERVWSTPMRTLALEFGLSDVGLAKICRKNGIPLPGLGHWRLVETGHPPEHQPLPAIEPGQHETITITAHAPESHSVLRKTDIGPVPDVEVKLDREITHPLAIRTKRAFQATSKNERGMLVPAEVKASHIRISAAALPRALRILDALFYAVEKQGYSVGWATATGARPKILVGGEELEPCVSEDFSRKAHTPTPEEIDHRKKNLYVYAPNWDYVPTGELHLALEGLPWGIKSIRSSWSDGKRGRVEKHLGELVATLPHLAEAIKRIREENERERLRREEEQRQMEERRRRQEEYDRRSKVVGEFLRAWKESQAFRDLAVAIEGKVESVAMEDGQKQEILTIAQWIARHAENINPLGRLEWMIKEFKEPGWKYY
jgi:hypothetical protein